MRRLLAKRRSFFSVEKKKAAENEPRRTVIVLPFAPEAIRQMVIVVEKQDGSIDVAGPIHETATCVRLLKAGMVRAVEWGERKQPGVIEVHQQLPPGLRDVGTG